MSQVSTGIFFVDLGVGRAASPQEFSASRHSCQGCKPSHLTQELVSANQIPEYTGTSPGQRINRSLGQVIQVADMGLPSFLLLDEESPTTDPVMPNLQKIAESQPSAVGHKHPRSHELGVRALHAADQTVSGLKQLMDLAVTPRHRAWRGPLDSSERADYTPVHQAFLSSEGEESLEHSSVVVHRVWGQVPQGLGQVGVDLVWIECLRPPRKPADQDSQLLQVSGRPADAVDVAAGKFLEFHEGTLRRSLPPDRGVATPQYNRYNPHPAGEGQLAQLVRTPVQTILRASLFTLLTAALWLPDLGVAMIAAGFRQLVFGQESLPKDGH